MVKTKEELLESVKTVLGENTDDASSEGLCLNRVAVSGSVPTIIGL